MILTQPSEKLTVKEVKTSKMVEAGSVVFRVERQSGTSKPSAVKKVRVSETHVSQFTAAIEGQDISCFNEAELQTWCCGLAGVLGFWYGNIYCSLSEFQLGEVNLVKTGRIERKKAMTKDIDIEMFCHSVFSGCVFVTKFECPLDCSNLKEVAKSWPLGQTEKFYHKKLAEFKISEGSICGKVEYIEFHKICESQKSLGSRRADSKTKSIGVWMMGVLIVLCRFLGASELLANISSSSSLTEVKKIFGCSTVPTWLFAIVIACQARSRVGRSNRAPLLIRNKLLTILAACNYDERKICTIFAHFRKHSAHISGTLNSARFGDRDTFAFRFGVSSKEGCMMGLILSTALNEVKKLVPFDEEASAIHEKRVTDQEGILKSMKLTLIPEKDTSTAELDQEGIEYNWNCSRLAVGAYEEKVIFRKEVSTEKMSLLDEDLDPFKLLPIAMWLSESHRAGLLALEDLYLAAVGLVYIILVYAGCARVGSILDMRLWGTLCVGATNFQEKCFAFLAWRNKKGSNHLDTAGNVKEQTHKTRPILATPICGPVVWILQWFLTVRRAISLQKGVRQSQNDPLFMNFDSQQCFDDASIGTSVTQFLSRATQWLSDETVSTLKNGNINLMRRKLYLSKTMFQKTSVATEAGKVQDLQENTNQVAVDHYLIYSQLAVQELDIRKKVVAAAYDTAKKANQRLPYLELFHSLLQEEPLKQQAVNVFGRVYSSMVAHARKGDDLESDNEN